MKRLWRWVPRRGAPIRANALAALLCGVFAVALGCAKTDDAESGATGRIESKSAPEPPGSAYGKEYESGTATAGDKKFKGRRVLFKNLEIAEISHSKEGHPYIAPLSVTVPGPLTRAPGASASQAPRVPAPCYFFFLRSEDDTKALRVGEHYDVTGSCLGLVKDDLWRGDVAGMNWHVDFVDCEVRPLKK